MSEDPSSKPIGPHSSEDTANRLLGLGWMLAAIFAVAIFYPALSKSHLPLILYSMPALPFVLLAWSRFKRIGWGLEEPEIDLTTIHHDEEEYQIHSKKMPGWQLWLIGAGVILALVVAIIVMDILHVGT